jgi:hypothetical protein
MMVESLVETSGRLPLGGKGRIAKITTLPTCFTLAG